LTLEEMLRRVYGAAMTPLPGPPRVDVGGLARMLEGVRGPSLPETMPQMPEAWRRYAEREGLYPSGSGAVGQR
jgi:hypothetical protein